MTTVETVLQGFGVRSDEGSVAFCGVYLLRDGARNILVDVGHVGRRSLLLSRLQARGIGPADIDSIVLTHAHWDHCLNADLFPAARILMSEREHAYVQDPRPEDWATPVWTTAVLGMGRVETVRDGEEVASGVRVLATPGHSPGSQTLLVQTPEGVVGLAGDALPNSACVAAGVPYLVFWNEDAARQSLARIVETCDRVYPGHDRPFRVHNGGFSYLEPATISFTGLPAAIDGSVAATFGSADPFNAVIAPWARSAAVAEHASG